jgi:hypothetical protein
VSLWYALVKRATLMLNNQPTTLNVLGVSNPQGRDGIDSRRATAGQKTGEQRHSERDQ